MNTLLPWILIALFAAGCTYTPDKAETDDVLQSITDSLEQKGVLVNSTEHLPPGITDTLIKGCFKNETGEITYASRTFHSLNIRGVRCRFKVGRSKVSKYYYRLKFESPEEEKEFQQFLTWVENYHYLRGGQATFYRKKGEWILEYIPFPKTPRS